jgi:hypothetical protein
VRQGGRDGSLFDGPPGPDSRSPGGRGDDIRSGRAVLGLSGLRPPADAAAPGDRSLAPKTGPRGPRPSLPSHRNRNRAYLATNPDHSPAEVRTHLNLDVSVSTVRRAVAALGLTFKKSR